MAEPDSKAKEITVGELADRSGVPASALRFYERQGLIGSRRTSGNQRRYSRETLRVVAFLRASQRLGIPLAVIGEVLALLPDGAAPNREFWIRASACWSAELNMRGGVSVAPSAGERQEHPSRTCVTPLALQC